jgi:ABC-type multidrug transport system ATPase subunit
MLDIIKTEGLSHSFGSVHAVRNIALRVPPGAVYGFLGPNGSGKSTTIRILLGLLHADRGQVTILGRPMPKDRKAIARAVGAMVEAPSLYDHLTGLENLDLTRRLLNLPAIEAHRTLEVVGLSADGHRRAGTFSLGMRQRLGIARALLGNPQLLILDEPMNGLDPAGVHEMRALIRDLPHRSGATVFLSSHLLAEVEQVASHVGLMFHGEVIAQSTLADLLHSVPASLEIEVSDAPGALARLRSAGTRCEPAGPGLIRAAVGPDAAPEAAEINNALVGEGFAVSSLRRWTPSLEDIFLDLTTGRSSAPEARHARAYYQ